VVESLARSGAALRRLGEAQPRYVAPKNGGKVGTSTLPDMGAAGLIAFEHRVLPAGRQQALIVRPCAGGTAAGSSRRGSSSAMRRKVVAGIHYTGGATANVSGCATVRRSVRFVLNNALRRVRWDISRP